MSGEGKHWGVDPGWVGESRPVPQMFKAEPFTPDEASIDTFEAEPFNGIEAGRDWVSLQEKLDAGGMALLMKFAAIGEPDAGTTRTA